ncbi:MAG: SDR family NAD(P)-dependent oxidoreductase, partial [candidate division Zixibacteria bacterium]|nr:SDR family NAD(P)-dependent oxidoreductase [candidate division Zixibacteria bacterium]
MMDREMHFKNKTVVVTGSGRGIGLVIAENFASLGANVVICDLDLEVVKRVASEIGGDSIGYKVDVSNPIEVENLFKSVMDRFGRLDVVVNNAGVTRDGLMVRMDEKDWDMVLDINLKGTFLITKIAARIMMKQRRGRIVNISSVAGLTGNIGQANYSASKAGLIGFTKTVAKELAPRGITVNAVAPGFIETEMTSALSDSAREQLL